MIPPFIVMDIEADGLFDDYYKKNATLIWCVCFLDQDKVEYIFVKDDLVEECSYDCRPLSEVPTFLKEVKTEGLICHNLINYDLRMLNKFLDIDYTIKPDMIAGRDLEIVDSLIDSKWLKPKRLLPWGCPGSIKPDDGGKSKIIGPHGLEAWGYRVKKKKPGIEDWERLHIDVYVDRCIEDTHINYGAFEIMNGEIAKFFDGMDSLAYWKTNRDLARMPIDIEHGFKQDITEQEVNGVPLDIPLAESLLIKFDDEMEVLRERIESHLPHIPIPPSRLKDYKFPGRPFKQDKKEGAVPSSYLNKFCEKWNGKVWKDDKDDWWVEIEVDGEKQEHKAPFPDYVKVTEQMTVGSEHLSQYIIDTYDWKPLYWNFQVDPITKKKFRDDKGKLVETTPRFKDAATGKICPHLISLEVPFIKDVIRFRTIKHRRSSIKSTTNDVKGYLNHPRLLIDGRLPAGMDTLGAATGRVTHKGVCNVPKADDDVLYGMEMRSLFYHGDDPDFYVLGYDASGIEARLEGSEAAAYDGGEYAKILTEDDIHELNAIFFDIKRGGAKSIKYGLGYGAGAAKIGQMLGVSAAQGKLIIDQWWAKYWAVAMVIEALQKEFKKNKSKFITGIDGRPLFMGSPHTALNYRLQNAGTLVMKLHACILRNNPKVIAWKEKGLVQKVIDYHDEDQYLVHKSLLKFKKVGSQEEGTVYFKTKNTTKPFNKDGQWWIGYCELGVLGCEAIAQAGRELGVTVPLTGDYAIGRNWGETH